MSLHGKNLIGAEMSGAGPAALHGQNPATGERLDPPFHEATEREVDRALEAAAAAFGPYRAFEPSLRADFLDAIGDELLDVGDALLARAGAETGLPPGRLEGERGRTVGQAKLFAALLREGSWVEARIDRAVPGRQPIPKPDVRRMLLPLGPAVVFGASNFPLAFSVAGGDTVSALAAGCPVVVKAHPAHPGTSELAAAAVLAAARRTGMPDGVFSLLHGREEALGRYLVQHPRAEAVAFTGSLRGGRALYNAAASRPRPIPVYAEMGSINPVFILPGAVEERGEGIAEGLCQSVTLGVGQFCTSPGLVVGLEGKSLERFRESLQGFVEGTAPGVMLHRGIREGFEAGISRLLSLDGVSLLGRARQAAAAERNEAQAHALEVDARVFLDRPELGEEVFGPSTLLVACRSSDEMLEVARSLEGHLTATIHGTFEDLRANARLVTILETKVGRLLFGGFPTGVEVCPSMQHGGPYPATTDSRTTSVGTAAIGRFARPVAYQGWPVPLLPPELRNRNERGIWRLIDGELTKDDA